MISDQSHFLLLSQDYHKNTDKQITKGGFEDCAQKSMWIYQG
jgi:hypothetical protein